MLSYKYSELKNKLKSNNKIILFGAGDIGELVKYSLNKISVKEDFYCDNDLRKHNTDYLGTKVISPKEKYLNSTPTASFLLILLNPPMYERFISGNSL